MRATIAFVALCLLAAGTAWADEGPYRIVDVPGAETGAHEGAPVLRRNVPLVVEAFDTSKARDERASVRDEEPLITDPCSCCWGCWNPCGWYNCRGLADYWRPRCCWRFNAAFVVWLAGMKGTLGVGDRDFDVDVTIGDVIENLDKVDGILQGQFGARYGRWWFTLAFSGLKLGDEIPIPQIGGAANAEIRQLFGQVNVNYRFACIPTSCCRCPSMLLYDAYVGARFYNMEFTISTPGATLTKFDETWVDPVVGGRITWDLRNRWAFWIDGDIGGFGAGSDFSWRALIGAEFRFNQNWVLKGGWQFLSADFETGSGASRFKWDVEQSGPMLAIEARW